jgi:hypothetical protein
VIFIWLNNKCCVCRNCELEYNPETKEGCKDCRYMRVMEMAVAYYVSRYTNEHKTIEATVCISRCDRFVPKQTGNSGICVANSDTCQG